MMAKNIMWILKQEEARGNGRIFISGHNGHVKKSGNYDAMIYVSDAHPIKVIEDQKKIDKLPMGYYNVSYQMVTVGE